MTAFLLWPLAALEHTHHALTRLRATQENVMPDELTPAEAALQALADINAVWASWTTGRLDTDDAMTAIRDHLTIAREQGALK